MTAREHSATPILHAPVDLAPASTYEALTRQMVEHVAGDVAAIRTRVDTLFYLVISSVIVDVLLRLAGA